MRRNLLIICVICAVIVLSSCYERRVNYRTCDRQGYAEYESREVSRSVDRSMVIVQGTEVPGDRDLGPGAGGERLGNPFRDQFAEADPVSGERYAHLRDNPFMRVAAPGGDASTFSLDVDTASYANCRRFLTQMNQLPPGAAVRIEELVNTIRYDYPEPDAEDGRPFRAITSVAACPWRPEHRLVRIALKARTIERGRRPPLNLVFLIDTSGSMDAANKLPLVQQSLNLLTELLRAEDRIAIVTYAGSAGTALAATPGDQHRRIHAVINGLSAEGSTNGAGGIQAAYAEAERNAAPGTMSRVMLCTDGDFNVGTTGLDDLRRLIERKRQSGVFLSVYGFGMGNLKDETLETLADKGNGVYGYIDGPAEARRLFYDEAMGQLVTVAKDAKVQVFFNPAAVSAWRLIGYEDRQLRREDFNNDRIDAGDIGAGHTVTALYEVVPAGQAAPAVDGNPFIANGDPVAVERGGLAIDPAVMLRLRLRYKDPEGETSRLLESDVPAAARTMDREFRFAAAVAGFGMILRGSPYRGGCDWDMVAQLAEAGLGDDPNGQRREFISLVARARELGRGR